jgi:hypothetical protein
MRSAAGRLLPHGVSFRSIRALPRIRDAVGRCILPTAPPTRWREAGALELLRRNAGCYLFCAVPFAYLPGFPHHAFVHTGVSKHVGKPVEYVRFGALTFPLGYSCVPRIVPNHQNSNQAAVE